MIVLAFAAGFVIGVLCTFFMGWAVARGMFW